MAIRKFLLRPLMNTLDQVSEQIDTIKSRISNLEKFVVEINQRQRILFQWIDQAQFQMHSASVPAAFWCSRCDAVCPSEKIQKERADDGRVFHACPACHHPYRLAQSPKKGA